VQEANKQQGRVATKGNKVHATEGATRLSTEGTRSGGKSQLYGQEGDGESA